MSETTDDAPGSPRAALLALVAAGGDGVQLLHVPGDVPRPARVAILDPAAPAEIRPGDVLLVVGTHPDDPAGVEATRRAGRAGAAAVAFRSGGVGEEALRAARASGVAFLHGAPATRWAALKSAWTTALAVCGEQHGAGVSSGLEVLLDTLAQSSRRNLLVLSPTLDVLSYSTPDADGADDVHSRAVLARRLPEAAAATLRDSAVLTAGPAGVRLSAAHHGTAVLDRSGAVAGYLWAQSLDGDDGPRSSGLDLIADELFRLRARRSSELDLPGRDLRSVLCDGGAPTSALATALDARPGDGLVVLSLRRVSRAGGHGDDHRPARALQIAASTGRALRIPAVQTAVGDTIYVLAVRRADVAPDRMLAFGTRLRWEIEQTIGGLVLVGVGEEVERLDRAERSRSQADRVVRALARRDAPRVATLPMVAGAALLDEIEAHMHASPSLQRGMLRALDDDPELLRTLRGYLDAFGDIGRAAETLHIHPNTLRYRLRRIARAGLDLGSAKERAVLSLQLRAADG